MFAILVPSPCVCPLLLLPSPFLCRVESALAHLQGNGIYVFVVCLFGTFTDPLMRARIIPIEQCPEGGQEKTKSGMHKEDGWPANCFQNKKFMDNWIISIFTMLA